MSKSLPELTDRQLKTYEVLAKIHMARVAFWFALGLFTVAFIVFVVALFTGKSAIITGISGIIDSILGVILKQVYSHLFPSQKT
jgi:hypothetical protein